MRKSAARVAVLAMVLAVPAAGADEPEDGGQTAQDLPYLEPRNPILAGTLSIVPGLGQVYNEQYGLGALYFVGSAGMYLAALAYTGVFNGENNPHPGHEAVFLFALAGGIHALSIFDATLEAVRVNENLQRWSVRVGPRQGGLSVACTVRF